MTSTESRSYVWATWASTTTTSGDIATSNGTTASDIWYTWNDWTNTSTITTDSTWTIWVDNHTTVAKGFSQGGYVPHQAREALTRTQRNREALLQRNEEMVRAREKAEEAARRLLLDILGDEERRVLEQFGRVFVRGKEGRLYLIPEAGHIQMIQGENIQDLCIHLEDKYKYPASDNMAAMKLLFESSEEEALQRANRHGRRAVGEQERRILELVRREAA